MTAITPMTELKAVNMILKHMGEAPVNSLSGNLPPEASQAQSHLLDVSEEVQKTGWFFNTEYRRLTPNHQGIIFLPLNALSVKTIGQSASVKVTIRGTRLYNITPFKNGFTFEGDVEVRMVLGLSFDELPVSARLYIAHKAARIMQVSVVGDAMSANDASTDEARALADLHADQLSAEPLTLLESPNVYDVISKVPSAYYRLT